MRKRLSVKMCFTLLSIRTLKYWDSLVLNKNIFRVELIVHFEVCFQMQSVIRIKYLIIID